AIIDIELSKVRERLLERGLKLVLTDEAKQFVIDRTKTEGAREHTDYGARPLRRSVELYIEDPLSEELLRGQFEGRNVITIGTKEVGDETQLEFVGSHEESAESELAAVSSSEGDGDSGESATAES
ncbi:MAG: NDP-hexose 4-ketoreductase, partial [Maioricimonas sp. JB045]